MSKQVLIKTKQRVIDHGEVFTPAHIVEMMCNKVPKEQWEDPSHIFLEPTCGNGNFLVHMLKKRLDAGVSLHDSLNSLWGMDICSDNIRECHERLSEIVATRIIEKGHSKKTKKFREHLKKAGAIILNNIYVVSDSIAEVKTKRFENKKFVYKDPTGETGVLEPDEARSLENQYEESDVYKKILEK